MTIDILTNDALLEIFDRFLDQARERNKVNLEAWHTLVHVCRKWRIIVFESPHHLNLQLLCTTRTRVREMLGVWPAFPIVIRDCLHYFRNSDTDNLIAALGHRDRVCEISLEEIFHSALEELMPVMQEPFPALTRLALGTNGLASAIPDSFLGGTGSHLRYLRLDGILFPELPKFLSSATGLVHLSLSGIPFPGHISAEVMVTSLSSMSKLESLCIMLPSSLVPLNNVDQPPPPTTCSLLPALSRLQFKGAVKYLEDLISWIEAPLIQTLDIAFIYEPALDTTNLRRLIGCAEQLTVLNRAKIEFRYDMVIALSQKTYKHDSSMLSLTVLHSEPDREIQSLVEACGSSLLPLSNVESLEITNDRQGWRSHLDNNTGNSQWLEVLRRFPDVKHLFLSNDIVSSIARTLINGNGEKETEVLPAIQKLSIGGSLPSGPVQEAIEQFAARRQLSADPEVPRCWVGMSAQDADD